MTPKTHHRSVELKHSANQAKVEQIAELLHWFSSACAVCKDEKIRHREPPRPEEVGASYQTN